ncbi:hypothetical protein UFOVP678_11 [uncultured Caudovirales phage]|uniref:Uncharacterized protein n=1 Tax=uncultured Caudovirales phage TaxID=2100421 RepID=A0A6J5NHH6_9CAUD|nr:hypothetical protein UFOVP678_11 [uncultured Caudovirales phage]
MSRRLYDFQCNENHITEAFVTYEVVEVQCSTCSKPAFRKLSAPRIHLEPFSGIFVSAASKWEKRRAEKLKQEQKQNQA